MTQTALGVDQLEAFRAGMLGPVLVEGDEGYDEARVAWNGWFDRRPGVIARCMGVADVQATVRFARENALRVAVRGGGHSMGGQSTIEGGLLIDLSLMRGVHVDPEKRTAVVAGGALFGEVDRDTAVHGLAVTGGMISHTGVAGLTLGGGIGRFMRKTGLTCDNVLSFDVVTADGEFRHVDAGNHPDLFWALCGGGGDFGIVTHFEFQLHPLNPIVYGGQLAWPIAQTKEVMAAIKEDIDNAPDELALQVLLITQPDLELIPEPLRGQQSLLLMITWMGDDHAEGERVIAPFREKVAPVMDFVGPVPYAFLQAAMDPMTPHGRKAFLKTGYIAELTDELIDIGLEQAANFVNPFSLVEFTRMGGAVARVPSDATPYAFRDAGWVYVVGANWDEDGVEPSEAPIGWARDADAAIRAVGMPGRYINFLTEEDDDFRANFGDATYARLSEVKAKYDPDGLFSRNPSSET